MPPEAAFSCAAGENRPCIFERPSQDVVEAKIMLNSNVSRLMDLSSKESMWAADHLTSFRAVYEAPPDELAPVHYAGNPDHPGRKEHPGPPGVSRRQGVGKRGVTSC